MWESPSEYDYGYDQFDHYEHPYFHINRNKCEKCGVSIHAYKKLCEKCDKYTFKLFIKDMKEIDWVELLTAKETWWLILWIIFWGNVIRVLLQTF